MKKLRISILGDGGWGTTLAILLFQKGFSVSLWGAFPEYVKLLKAKRVNSRFLPGVKIPAQIEITSDLKAIISEKDLIVFAIPSQYIRGILKNIKNFGFNRDCVYLSVSKGIEIGSLKRISEIINDELKNVKLGVLSGPTIAHEVIEGKPATAIVAAGSKELSEFLQDVFMSDTFRIYTSTDITGVELGGSLKNVIAIACGISDGLNLGTNAKAALLSRGLAEISRLGVKMGAKAKTFSGLSGLGDLVTTCSSPYSRNRSVGELIGKGKTLAEIKKHMQMVAEGVPTAKSAYMLSRKFSVEMPVTKEVYSVLYNN
ncbi:MAG: NAD(P)H-dependent glycerol-3-phosphate dehydrogenase, partial [Candidatus Omnitrophota bacterium]